MIIYKATNLINGKIYIGQTIQGLRRRKNQEISQARRKTHNYKFDNAIRKYGSHNFAWEEVAKAKTLKELNDKEEFWIKKAKSHLSKFGYNIRLGGSNSRLSDATKKKIGDRHRGRKHSPEFCKRISEWQTGRKRGPMPDETKIKIGKGNTGKIRSDKTKEILRKISTGKKHSKESGIKKSLATRGEKCYCAKITETQALEILDKLSNGERQADLAREYGLTDGAIYRLKKGLSWRHIKRCH